MLSSSVLSSRRSERKNISINGETNRLVSGEPQRHCKRTVNSLDASKYLNIHDGIRRKQRDKNGFKNTNHRSFTGSFGLCGVVAVVDTTCVQQINRQQFSPDTETKIRRTNTASNDKRLKSLLPVINSEDVQKNPDNMKLTEQGNSSDLINSSSLNDTAASMLHLSESELSFKQGYVTRGEIIQRFLDSVENARPD